ncbi:unnamed protein product [Lactuca saligna]|uniref:BTB domain-containing protein n=1 Tax=Lactuca saligna TaxID=75948 RepID=A0AA35YWA5_LACSI|nr:unnamed protein product [Lactuca saligna]
MRSASSNFIHELLKYEIPYTAMILNMPKYDNTSNPDDHVDNYGWTMTSLKMDRRFTYTYFRCTLTGNAGKWFKCHFITTSGSNCASEQKLKRSILILKPLLSHYRRYWSAAPRRSWAILKSTSTDPFSKVAIMGPTRALLADLAGWIRSFVADYWIFISSLVDYTLLIKEVYLGEQYVNNPTLSDVTLMIEGKRFYAHRICLLASSDAFRAMFDGGYRLASSVTEEETNTDKNMSTMFDVLRRNRTESTITVKLLVFRFLTGCEHLFLPFLPFTCRLMIFQECSDYFPKIPHGLDSVSSMFKQHVAAEGTTLVKQAKDVASNKKAEKRLQVDPAT